MLVSFGHHMNLLDEIFKRIAIPFGLLFSLGYAVEEIRVAVADYIPESLIAPIGLVMYFAFGACVALSAALLVVPEAALNQPGNREDLKAVLGVYGAHAVRSIAATSLGIFLFVIWIIIDKAYG